MQDPLIGHRLANFVIERPLGRGGMAQVYFGRDVNLQRPVAIKVIDARFRSNPTYAARFINEARVVASWRHENIIQIFYADQEDDLYYFVMEYIDGMDLASLLWQYAKERELMPYEDVLKIGRAVANALDYAHNKGVVHRDVKPSNVMISVDDRVVLTDFGLALDVHQGSRGEVFGSPHYIAPEQARSSAEATAASDIYSFGVMLYEMLTGKVPFDDPSFVNLVLKHLSLMPPPPRSLNPALNVQTERVLLKALSKRPEDRYKSAVALINALETALYAEPEAVPSDPASPDVMATIPLSETSVAERVAVHVRSAKTEAMPEPPRIPQTEESQYAPPASASEVSPPKAPRAAGARSVPALILALAILFIGVIGVGVVALVLGNARDDSLPVTESLTSGVGTPPTAIAVTFQGSAGTAAVAALPSDPPAPTASPTASTTAAPSAAATPTIPRTLGQVIILATAAPATATAAVNLPLPPPPTLPPESPTPLPTATAFDAPPPTPITLQPVGQPTAVPAGRRVQFLWDANSFYWHNPQVQSIMVSPIRFDAIDAAGQPVGYAFEGWRWAGVGFNRIESGKCAAIEMLRVSGWMRPSLCRGYNSFVNTQRESDLVFWVEREGVTQFRVLWNGQEVARCAISAGSCEAYVP